MTYKISLFFLALSLLFSVTAAFAQMDEAAPSENLPVLTEEAKIENLIAFVENMPEGTKFIRNGTEYDGERAASHLRLKYRNGKRYAKTAELFIENIASKSSMSGEEYSIKLADGKTVSAREFFMEELRKIEGAGG
ncbi:MAG: DUF5329 domain-containing protein [Deltaproteobacteria bacterium]|jgi:Rieske Fe-S protein|nr:DUF5329 domain-containing protein [Deltaproteobacteria bacterium]